MASGLLFTVLPVWAKGKPQFIAVRIWPANAYTRLTLESSDVLDYRYFTLDNPKRLVVDIRNVRLNQVLQSLGSKVQASDPYISGIRVGQNNEHTVRVVMDLKADVNPQLFILSPIASFRHRLVIDLYPAASTDSDDPLLALLNDYSKGKISRQGTGASTPPVQTADNQRTQQTKPSGKKRQAIVVLDAGHGGEDPGAISPSGLREKDVVLSIARETKKRMEKLGYKVYMTRNEDVFIPLGVRVAKARKLRADVFVSIHADAFTNPSARGTGVYVLSTTGASSAAARFLAQTQNDADLIGGVQSVGNKNVDGALLDMVQTATGKDSRILADYVLKELGKHNKLHKGIVDQANFAVLRAPDIPSILVETAFLSNPIEEKMLASADFRHRCADAITNGVKSYLSGAILARA